MNTDRKVMLEKIALLQMKSPFIQILSRRYPVEIFPDEDGFIVRIELRDCDRQLIDVFDLPVSDEFLVDYEVLLHFVVVAFEVGLECEIWKAAGKRIRKMKF